MAEVYVYQRVDDPGKEKQLRKEALKVLQGNNPVAGSYSIYVTPAIIIIEQQR